MGPRRSSQIKLHQICKNIDKNKIICSNIIVNPMYLLINY